MNQIKKDVVGNDISSLGHLWTPPAGALPAVLKAREARRRTMAFTHKWTWWSFDYFFTDGVEVAVGEPPTRFVPREKFTARLYRPGVTYAERSTEGAPPLYSAWLAFNGGEVVGLNALLNGAGMAHFIDTRRVLGDMVRRMAQTAHTYGDGSYLRIQAMFFELADLLLRSKKLAAGSWEVVQEDAVPRIDPLIVKVRSYLQAHMDDRVTLERLARELAVSVSTLAHRYSAGAGEGPLKTLMKMRIQAVKDLMRRGMTLKEIADRTGFGNPYHLSRAFKTVEGVPPSVVRGGRRFLL